jgi:hypothetical protein
LEKVDVEGRGARNYTKCDVHNIHYSATCHSGWASRQRQKETTMTSSKTLLFTFPQHFRLNNEAGWRLWRSKTFVRGVPIDATLLSRMFIDRKLSRKVFTFQNNLLKRESIS